MATEKEKIITEVDMEEKEKEDMEEVDMEEKGKVMMDMMEKEKELDIMEDMEKEKGVGVGVMERGTIIKKVQFITIHTFLFLYLIQHQGQSFKLFSQ